MISNNTKVERLLRALAVELKDLSDDKIKKIHDMINDNSDGYNFDFVSEVNSIRYFVIGN
jgi:hypothetical protein